MTNPYDNPFGSGPAGGYGQQQPGQNDPYGGYPQAPHGAVQPGYGQGSPAPYGQPEYPQQGYAQPAQPYGVPGAYGAQPVDHYGAMNPYSAQAMPPAGAQVPGIGDKALPVSGAGVSAFPRFGAQLLDGFIFFIIALIVFVVLAIIPILGVLAIIMLVLIGRPLYNAICESNWGATPAKKMLGWKVIDIRTGGNLTFGRAFLRNVWTLGGYIPLVGIFVPIAVGVSISGDPQGRAWHDRMADAAVIRK